MTTLSKEEFKLLLANSVASPDLDKVQDAIADLVAENERLKSYFSEERGKLLGTINTIDRLTDQLINQLTATRTALAAADAWEAKLIAALDQAESALCEIRDFPLTYLEVSEALAQPRDDSALREMIAGVYEECEKVCELMNYTDPQPHHYAYAIRALAEKAKGK